MAMVPASSTKGSTDEPYVHEVLAETRNNDNTTHQQSKRQTRRPKLAECNQSQEPEQNVRKKELCTYLNLLNLDPSDREGNENRPLLERRSKRLSNNILLKKRTELEKQLQNEEREAKKQRLVVMEPARKCDMRAKSIDQKTKQDLVEYTKHLKVVLHKTDFGIQNNNFDIHALQKRAQCNRCDDVMRRNRKYRRHILASPARPPPENLAQVANIELEEYRNVLLSAKTQSRILVKRIVEKCDVVALGDRLLAESAPGPESRLDEATPTRVHDPRTTKCNILRAMEKSTEDLDVYERELSLTAKEVSLIIGVAHSDSPSVTSVARNATAGDKSNLGCDSSASRNPDQEEPLDGWRDVPSTSFVDIFSHLEGGKTGIAGSPSHITPEPLLPSDHTYSSAKLFLKTSNPSRLAGRRGRVNHSLESMRTHVDKAQHAATLPRDGGAVLSCYFNDYWLVVAQTHQVSFFQQSGLGMSFESQSMWISRGSIARLNYDASCVRKLARDCVLHTLESGPAYVELYAKEHNHANCDTPGCDLFVVLYFHGGGDAGPRCKLHQLEKFSGYARSVKFVIVQRLNCVMVYYESQNGTMSMSQTKRTIACYSFSVDYQSVQLACELDRPPHRIDCLLAVEDSDRLLVGCYNDPPLWSFWNGVELVKTIDASNLYGQAITASSTFRADCGVIFALQELKNGYLRLTAVNVMTFSHKTLQIYRPPAGCRGLRHSFMYEGQVVALYDRGRACWNMESGKLISSGAAPRPAGSSSWPYAGWLITVRRKRVYMQRVWKAVIAGGRRRRYED